MEHVALITLLLLTQYLAFMGKTGKARAASGIKAPAMTGDDTFERAVRIQTNTLEQLIMTLPAMWICAQFLNPLVAAGLGAVFLIGRFIYGRAYAADPSKRGIGMMIGFVATFTLIILSFWGVISAMITKGA